MILSAKKINLYYKFIGFFIKNGKKNRAVIFITQTFLLVAKTLQKSFSFILLRLFRKLNIFLEARNVVIRRRKFIVPFSINIKRRLFLVVKWLLESAKKNQKKISLSQKLIIEIFALLKKKTNSKALFLKKKALNLALINRSNMHFRW